MPRIVRGGLIQATLVRAGHVAGRQDQAGDDRQARRADRPGRRPRARRSSACRSCFYGPYFCAEQQTKWYDLIERDPRRPDDEAASPSWPRSTASCSCCRSTKKRSPALYYNTAAVIDADGTYLGKFRKIHIPQVQPGFWEKYYFRPGNLGYPVFNTQVRARSASTSATTATSPKGPAAWA